MATKKKLLQAAAGTAAASGGAGALNVESVFSTYLYEGNGGTQVIENGINLGQSNDGGSISFNLDSTVTSVSATDDTDYINISNNSIINFGTGDFTIEFWSYLRGYGTNEYADFIGGGASGELGFGVYGGTLYYGAVQVSNVLSTSFTSYVDKWTHVALVRSSGTSKIYLDGTEITSASDSSNWASGNGVLIGRYGTRVHGVQGYMSNVRVVKGTAVYTSNFTPSTSALTAVSGTELLVGQGSTPFVDNSSNAYTVVNNDAKASTFGPFDAADAGEGGLVWIKRRSQAQGHGLFDTERGEDPYLGTDSTNPPVNASNGVVYNSDGFTNKSNSYFGGSGDGNGEDFASWTFRKAPKFFDVVTATAPSSGTLQVSHNLGTTVGCIILKSTSDTDNWVVYHRGMGANYYATMNQTNPWINVTGVFDGVTDTYFTLDPSKNCTAGRTYVAYVFAHNDGDADFGPTGDQDVISCGSFTSDSNGDISVELGWEPQFVLYRRTDQGGVWIMTDTMRGMSVNGGTNINYLAANASNAEANNATGVYPTPTGIGGNFNASANTPAIYIAIRRGPMAVPTDATDVFEAKAYTGDGTSDRQIGNLKIDMNMIIDRTNTSSMSNQGHVFDRLRGDDVVLKTNIQGSEGGGWADSYYNLDRQHGFDNGSDTSYFNKNNSVYVSYIWKRAFKYFDMVAYEGNGTAGRTVSHNLGVAPEMMWVKKRNGTANWIAYHKDIGNNAILYPNLTNASFTTTDYWNSTTPTESVFTLGGNGNVNGSGDTYIAYLFASLDGVSKVGSFTHTNGTATNVDCGFSSGARFVLWKPSSFSGNWIVMDTERGIVSGNDPYLNLNTTDAENSSYDIIDALSSGFTVGSVAASGTYIFYAIA